jgi:hypothetical protein
MLYEWTKETQQRMGNGDMKKVDFVVSVGFCTLLRFSNIEKFRSGYALLQALLNVTRLHNQIRIGITKKKKEILLKLYILVGLFGLAKKPYGDEIHKTSPHNHKELSSEFKQDEKYIKEKLFSSFVFFIVSSFYSLFARF